MTRYLVGTEAVSCYLRRGVKELLKKEEQGELTYDVISSEDLTKDKIGEEKYIKITESVFNILNR